MTKAGILEVAIFGVEDPRKDNYIKNLNIMKIEWKFASPISIEKVDEVAKMENTILPSFLKKVISEGNNGTPSKNAFSFGNNEEDFKTLLSYNPNDKENVYKAIKILKEAGQHLYPFANDPAGDLICLEGTKVVLWDHETNTIIPLSNNVEDFFNSLH